MREKSRSFSHKDFLFYTRRKIMKKVYKTKGVCSREISFDYEDGKIFNLSFVGGCNGNLKAISRLCEGKSLVEIEEVLRGNTCGPRDTSCADQLAKAIKEVLEA
jgi:uncharacterized protein (TIGR03905 family)